MNSPKIETQLIRNFCIIAHVDHGKSTLASLLLRTLTTTFSSSEALFRINLEKSRGITIKLHSIQLRYKKFYLNLIDTPGHTDFKNEVLVSLSVCEGAILLVDAVKGVQAQTVFYYQSAQSLALKILPVITKIDLPLARVELVKKQISELTGCFEEEILSISSKTACNIDKLIAAIVLSFPAPKNKLLAS